MIALNNIELISGVLFVEVTNACNYRCQHCYLGELPTLSNESVRLTNILTTIKHFEEMGIREIRFTGGEPLISSALARLITFCSAHNIQYTIVSNGSGVRPSAALALRRYKPRIIWVSLYGNTPILHDNMTASVGSFRRLQKTVGHLRADGIQCGVHVVVSPQLMGAIGDVLDFAFQELGVSEAKCIPVQLAGSVIMARQRLILTCSEVRNARSQIIAWARKHPERKIRTAGRLVRDSALRTGCLFDRRVFLTINHLGKTSPCCLLMHNKEWLFNSAADALTAARQITTSKLPCNGNKRGVCPLLLDNVVS